MPYSKSYPKTTKGSNYPKWVEVSLTQEEELAEEVRCKYDNIELMKECLEDAKKIIQSQDLKRYQTDLVNVAIALFRKRSSYAIHYKESKTKEKFDKIK